VTALTGLTVFHWAGRWWAHWTALEETRNPNLPPEAKRELVRIVGAEDPEAPYGLEFQGV
jgi:hypothetical protein